VVLGSSPEDGVCIPCVLRIRLDFSCCLRSFGFPYMISQTVSISSAKERLRGQELIVS